MSWAYCAPKSRMGITSSRCIWMEYSNAMEKAKRAAGVSLPGGALEVHEARGVDDDARLIAVHPERVVRRQAGGGGEAVGPDAAQLSVLLAVHVHRAGGATLADHHHVPLAPFEG